MPLLGVVKRKPSGTAAEQRCDFHTWPGSDGKKGANIPRPEINA